MLPHINRLVMIKFHYENAQFDYEPYPICYIPNFLDAAVYKELQESYPALELFKFNEKLGNKYALAEKNNGHHYYAFLKKNPIWREFYRTVKSKQFVQDTFAFLRAHHVDLNVRRFVHTKNINMHRRNPIWRIANKRMLRSRFDFSIMTANGGNILPHTDIPKKMVTLVLSFIKPGEWKKEWGGGTNVLLPKDRSKIFCLDGQRPFDEMEHIKTFPFNENQCVLFVKTYNSWHSVMPMTGPADAQRKTVTINIENII